MLTYVTAQSALGDDSKGGSINVLLVNDWSENLARVKSMLRLSPHVVTYAQTTEEFNPICQDFYDFVVVDVGPEHIVDALREIRVMPCSDFELMRLVTARSQGKNAARFHLTSSSQESPLVL